MTTATLPQQAPTPEVAEEAKVALRVLREVPRSKNQRGIALHSNGGGSPSVTVTVPHAAFELFLEILGQMANGNAVTIVPVHAELTTQQAADILNVSRPYLIQLIEDRKIPCTRIGTHRRIRFDDLMAYKEKADRERRAVLAELTAEAQKHDLGY